MKLENRQIGVFATLIIAFIMLFLPGPENSKYKFNPDLLAKAIVENEDQVSPQQLSEWIIEGKNNYQLIDIRSEKEFTSGHIKTAENIPLETLLKRKTIEQDLNTNKFIILYSNGNSHAHQCWLVLKTAGIDCYVLQGGYNYWNKIIMNPQLPADSSDDEILRYKKDKKVSEYYGGNTTTSDAEVNSGKKIKKKLFKRKNKGKLEGC